MTRNMSGLVTSIWAAISLVTIICTFVLLDEHLLVRATALCTSTLMKIHHFIIVHIYVSS